jgi:hypothetical protein
MFAATVSTFSVDSIALPTWADNLIHSTRKAAAYSSIVIKAFRKTLAPQIATTAKDLSHYYVQCGKGAGQWAMSRAGITHNPIQAAVRSAHAELTSAEAAATYRRVRHITRETALDALVIGLCGVVAVAVGIEAAQTIYRHVKRFHGKVYAWLNPSPLPSAEMARASADLAAALSTAADVAEAQVSAKALPLSVAEPVPDFWAEPMPLIHTPPVFGQVWNPPGRDMHTEVERLLELQSVPLTLAAAPEPVEQPTDQAPVLDEIVTTLDVPGATGKRTSKAKAGYSKTGTKAAKAEPKPSAGKGRGVALE